MGGAWGCCVYGSTITCLAERWGVWCAVSRGHLPHCMGCLAGAPSPRSGPCFSDRQWVMLRCICSALRFFLGPCPLSFFCIPRWLRRWYCPPVCCVAFPAPLPVLCSCSLASGARPLCTLLCALAAVLGLPLRVRLFRFFARGMQRGSTYCGASCTLCVYSCCCLSRCVLWVRLGSEGWLFWLFRRSLYFLGLMPPRLWQPSPFCPVSARCFSSPSVRLPCRRTHLTRFRRVSLPVLRLFALFLFGCAPRPRCHCPFISRSRSSAVHRLTRQQCSSVLGVDGSRSRSNSEIYAFFSPAVAFVPALLCSLAARLLPPLWLCPLAPSGVVGLSRALVCSSG